jgi:hypothetical protein
VLRGVRWIASPVTRLAPLLQRGVSSVGRAASMRGIFGSGKKKTPPKRGFADCFP